MAASTDEDIIVKVGYQKGCCCLSEYGKKAPYQIFYWVKKRMLDSGNGFEILSSLLLPAYKLCREKGGGKGGVKTGLKGSLKESVLFSGPEHLQLY